MSYIDKIQKDFDDKLFSKDDFELLIYIYNSLSDAEQWELDGKPKTAVFRSRLYEMKGSLSEVGNLKSINENLHEIKQTLLFFLIVFILSILIMIIPIWGAFLKG